MEEFHPVSDEEARCYRQLDPNSPYQVGFERGAIQLWLGSHDLYVGSPDDFSSLQLQTEADCVIVCPALEDRSHVGVVELHDNTEVLVGRDSQDFIGMLSPTVSRKHARLSRNGQTIIVEDLGSSNGTTLSTPQHVMVWPLLPTRELNSQSDAEKLLRVAVSGTSEASRYHPNQNEDALFVNEPARMIGVFDGVGGADRSARAASLAAAGVEWQLREYPEKLTRQAAQLAIQQVLLATHEAILRRASGAMTTAAVARVFADEQDRPFLAMGNTGDSRVYRLRNGLLEHLTLDDAVWPVGSSDAERMGWQLEMARANNKSDMSGFAQQLFRQRSTITNCLGDKQDPPRIATNVHDLRLGDTFMMLTDGVHDNITDEAVSVIMQQGGDPDRISQLVVRYAQEQSETPDNFRAKPDDMTAAVMQVLAV